MLLRSVLALAFFCAGLLAASGAKAVATGPDLLTPSQRTWLAAHPRVVLGAGEDWAPWVIKESKGEVKGLAADHLDLINRKLGTDIRLEVGPWPEIVAKAESGAIDGLTLTAPLPERRDRFEFTEPYFTDHDFYFLRTEDLERKQPVGLDDLRGKRVGYAKGTLRIGRVLAERPGITAVIVDNYDELARQLIRGDIDVAVASYSLEYWRATNGVQGFAPTRIVRETDARLVMTIRKDRAELVGILNAGLAALKKEELEPLYLRWFGADHLRRTASFAATFTAEERAWLAQHPVVRVAIDPQWAPVEFVDSGGVPRGMSLAYLDRISVILGTRFEVVPGPSWVDAMRRLDEHEIDLLPAITENAERRAHMRFTEPYLSFPAAIFSAADVAYLGNPESLRGKTVAVVQGEAVEPWLRKEWPDLSLLPVADTREALRTVADGKAFAFIGNLVTTSYYIGQSGLTQIKVAGETPFVYRLGMAVREDWPMLPGILQKAIEAIPAAERDSIYRDWISIRYQHSIDYSLLWKALAAASLALLLVFGERTYRLNRANARLKHLAQDLSLVEERERRRLAGELHDSPMQKLALAQMQFSAMGREAELASAERKGTGERLGTGLELMREAIDELRSLQFELSPPMLYQEGLAPTLGWLASRATERSGVAFSFRDAASAAKLPQELAIFLFQCARELVYNAAKHASATTGTIELGVDDANVLLTVTDDGKGFSDSARKQRSTGGFGLFNIRERLALVGGDLSIQSGAAGTRACVRVPLHQHAGHGHRRADVGGATRAYGESEETS
jgi:signal transduction histidine kinase